MTGRLPGNIWISYCDLLGLDQSDEQTIGFCFVALAGNICDKIPKISTDLEPQPAFDIEYIPYPKDAAPDADRILNISPT